MAKVSSLKTQIFRWPSQSLVQILAHVKILASKESDDQTVKDKLLEPVIAPESKKIFIKGFRSEV